MTNQYNVSRRRFLQMLAFGASGLILPSSNWANRQDLIKKTIPSSQKKISAIGLGSSRTFNVGNDPVSLDNVAEVMRHFFAGGGQLIDSSPMYGSSQAAIGYGLKKLSMQEKVFSAEKVWTWDTDEGPLQMETSRQLWGVKNFDLMQVHNLVGWQEHIKTLYQMKKQGNLKYIGITTSHGRAHDEFAEVMQSQQLDFVQLSYNILDREVEKRLLPLAQKRNIAVIVNRPFQRGDLIDELQGKLLPGWAKEIDCQSWPQFLLKFIISHPAVTCVIPATSQVKHVQDNMQAGYGRLPDQAMRQRMIGYVENII